jgi:hypothetical protein
MRKRPKSTTHVIVGAIMLGIVGIAGVAVYQIHAAADSTVASNSLTLSPDLFQGETQQAYLVAQQHPELLAQLHCYCGCEQHEGHKNLLDCFRDNHGAGCATCVGEAVTAGQLADSGMPVDQIYKSLRERYGHGG